MAKRRMTVQEFARLGGKACAAKRTPEERSEAARRAVRARWDRAKAPAVAPVVVTSDYVAIAPEPFDA